MGLILPHAPQFSRFESNIQATPSNVVVGTTVSHPTGGAHTKDTTWTELIAATGFDSGLVAVSVMGNTTSTQDSSTLLDIGIGAATEESVIIPDLMAGWVATLPARYYTFPLRIPAGSRLSARTQSVLTTGGVSVLVQLWGGPSDPDGWWAGQSVTCYGANAANSAGVKFTPGNAGAETATPVAVGTTTSDHECLVLGIQGHPDDTGWATGVVHIDVGIDASGTSWLMQDAYVLATSSAENIGVSWTPWLPIWAHVPSGTSLVVGGEHSGTGDALSAAIYGIS